jgi:hypothetical protein
MALKILKENEEGFGIIIDKEAGSISKELNNTLMTEGYQMLDLTKPVIYYATLQKYGVENRNGRIYPKDILMREVDKYQEVINKNASFHELDHPQESVISLKGGSPHRILELTWKGNALIGKLEILVSEGYRKSGIISCHGDLVAHYLSYGMTLGISSRGVGSLKKIDGKNIVQDDFELICWDIVSSPSTPGSYLYKELEDFAKYDEASPEAEPMIATGGNKQDEFMSKLSKFLSK